jgi:hypothetical protein
MVKRNAEKFLNMWRKNTEENAGKKIKRINSVQDASTNFEREDGGAATIRREHGDEKHRGKRKTNRKNV